MDALLYPLSLLIGLVLGNLLPSYFSKKGENLATKEDIDEITRKIESVKNEYAHSLESTKAELSAKISTYGHRYQNEYKILIELNEHLFSVRDHAINLRPVLDFKDPNKSEDEIKQDRIGKLWESRRALYLCSEKYRPFYPENIYQKIKEIDQLANSETNKYRFESPFDPKNFSKYWDEAEANQEKIKNLTEQSIDLLRSRVTTWDSLYETQVPA